MFHNLKTEPIDIIEESLIIMDSDNENDDDDEIFVVSSLTQKNPTQTSIDDLYDRCIKGYDMRKKKGTVCYEYFNAMLNQVKVHIDYEEYLDLNYYSGEIDNDIQSKLTEILCSIFEIKESELAISNDTRSVNHNNKKQMKISFHFVIWSKKCKITDLKKFIEYHLPKFKEVGLKGIDSKIYRNGINKFRIPMTKKSKSDSNSLLIPKNYKSKENFHKHLVSHIEGCELIDLTNIDYVRGESNNISQEINDRLESYKITHCSEKEGYICYTLKNFYCGEVHENNHNVLYHSLNTNILTIKCLSERCKDYKEVIYKPSAPTIHLNINYLNNIPIPHKKNDNYLEVKQYFESFIIYLRDSNSYYRIRRGRNDEYDYLEKTLKAINIDGFKKDLYYREIKPDKKDPKTGEIIEHEQKIKLLNFYKRWEVDMNKKAYYSMHFNPIADKNKGFNNFEYNLFEGFNYNNILTHRQKKNIPDDKLEDFKFFISHIKNYICNRIKAKTNKKKELSKKLFSYLMYFLANIIQEPKKVTQIIPVFFSQAHGTGKSGFTKFISQVIGSDLSYFASLEQLLDKHSNGHVAKLLNIIDEVNISLTKQHDKEIKNWSQRECAIYNEKGKPAYTIKCYVRYIDTTNFGVYFDPNDRRYVIYTFDKYEGTIDELNEYCSKLNRIMKDPYTVYQFGIFLKSIDIPYKQQREWETNRPLTDDYHSMMSSNPITEFLKEFISLENISLDRLDDTQYLNSYQNLKDSIHCNHILIKKNALFNLYKTYCKDTEEKKILPKKEFTNHIETHFKETIISGKRRFGKDYNPVWCYLINLEKLNTKIQKNIEFKNKHINS